MAAWELVHGGAPQFHHLQRARRSPGSTRPTPCSPPTSTQWAPHTFTDPAAAATLRALRTAGLKIGVLSNTLWPRDWHEDVFRRDGVLDLIDGAVYSSEIDWAKPHPEAFRAAMTAVGATDPSRCVFVGDRPWDDIHGAKSVGMRAVLVPHSRGTGVRRRPNPTP